MFMDFPRKIAGRYPIAQTQAQPLRQARSRAHDPHQPAHLFAAQAGIFHWAQSKPAPISGLSLSPPGIRPACYIARNDEPAQLKRATRRACGVISRPQSRPWQPAARTEHGVATWGSQAPAGSPAPGNEGVQCGRALKVHRNQ